VRISPAGGDYPTLKAALAEAPPGVLLFILPEGIFTETDIQIGREAVILGAGTGKTFLQGASVPGEAPDRILTVLEGGRAELRDLTLRNGTATRILRRGGGILNLGYLRMDNCIVRGNSAVYGAGLDNRGRAVITRSEFRENFCLPRNPEEIRTGVGCTGSGGGIKNEPGGFLLMEDCDLSGNEARSKGGGLFVSCESRAVLNRCRIRDNTSRASGGGIHVRGELSLFRCTVSGNSAGRGAGGIHNLGILDLSSCRIRNNNGADLVLGSGAGMYGEGTLGLDRNSRIGP